MMTTMKQILNNHATNKLIKWFPDISRKFICQNTTLLPTYVAFVCSSVCMCAQVFIILFCIGKSRENAREHVTFFYLTYFVVRSTSKVANISHLRCLRNYENNCYLTRVKVKLLRVSKNGNTFLYIFIEVHF